MAEPTTHKASSSQGMSAEERASEFWSAWCGNPQKHWDDITDELANLIHQAEQDARRKALEPTKAQIQAIYDTPDLIWERGDGTKWIRWEDLPLVLRALAESTER